MERGCIAISVRMLLLIFQTVSWLLFYDKNTLDIIRGGGYGVPGFSDTAGEWKSFDYSIRVPAIANYFVFEIHSYAGTTFYVDDCYVIDLDN
mgnify:CR=1 FL=1